MNYSAVLLRPIYRLRGVDATFEITRESSSFFGDVVEIRVLDKSGGHEVTANEIGVPQVLPACIMRMRDLAELEMAPEDLVGANVTMNDVEWRVQSYYPKPSPNGIADGELYVVLEEKPS